MIEFNLPNHKNITFKAHDTSVFHKLGELCPSLVSEKKQKEYYKSITNIIRNDNNILPGDTYHMTCYWYPTRDYYGLYMVVIGENGEKTSEAFGDGLDGVYAGGLYKELLKVNPDFFRTSEEEISEYIGAYDSLTREVNIIIKEYDRLNNK